MKHESFGLVRGITSDMRTGDQAAYTPMSAPEISSYPKHVPTNMPQSAIVLNPQGTKQNGQVNFNTAKLPQARLKGTGTGALNKALRTAQQSASNSSSSYIATPCFISSPMLS